MSRQVLQIKLIDDIAKDVYSGENSLSYQTLGSSGFDLRANKIITTDLHKIALNISKEGFILESGKRVQIGTGISVSMLQGYEIQIRSRSGLAWKNGIFVLNSPGTVDSDYRGEICVVLFNTSNSNFCISYKDRIAQAVFCAVEHPKFQFVEELDETDRGSGGYGSTGVK